MLQLASLAAVTLLASGAAAQGNMLRFACSQLVVDRTDPIVEPGVRYAAHLHQIVGGNAFNLTMDPNTYGNPADKASCTSCSFVQDASNYWTAVMFFKAKNGSYTRVPQIGNGGPQGQLVNKGGLDIYYIPSGKVTSFKPGFRMVAGDAKNTVDSKVAKGAICHRCWTSKSENTFVGGAPCSGSDTVAIPQKSTCNFIRQTLIFPHCWDGKNLDSPDHKSHMAYSGSGYGANGGGTCPSTHPVKMPQIMYELMWDVSKFTSNTALWPSDASDSNPALMYSMNLGGSAAHGDYVFGWKGDSLQKAMDKNCNLNKDCPAAGLTYQAPDKYNACTIKQQSPEAVDGWIAAMPMGQMAIKG